MVLFAIEHTSTTQNKQPGSLQPSLVFEAEGVQYLITNRLPVRAANLLVWCLLWTDL